MLSSTGVYMTNPLNLVPEADILQQLCTDSLLLVRRDDIVSHWTNNCDLTLLIRQQDPRWRTMNVLGGPPFLFHQIYQFV